MFKIKMSWQRKKHTTEYTLKYIHLLFIWLYSCLCLPVPLVRCWNKATLLIIEPTGQQEQAVSHSDWTYSVQTTQFFVKL